MDNDYACKCINIIYEQYENICIDCGKIYECTNNNIITYEEINNYKGQYINTKYNPQIDDVSYILLKKTSFKGNNRLALKMLIELDYYCKNNLFNNKIINLMSGYTLSLFIKSKKLYKKLLEDNIITVDNFEEFKICSIVYYVMYYGLLISLSDEFIFNCISNTKTNYKLLLKNCVDKTIAITILYKYTSKDFKKELMKYISQPTIIKILKLI